VPELRLRPLHGHVKTFQITVRYGQRYQRYHTFTVQAPDVAVALRQAADQLPAEILPEADLVELRPAVDPDARPQMTLG
jgi:hypothetical protein